MHKCKCDKLGVFFILFVCHYCCCFYDSDQLSVDQLYSHGAHFFHDFTKVYKSDRINNKIQYYVT